MSAPGGPIADLSYRNYDGPKSVDGFRWWSIAKNGIRGAMRKKFFWVLVALAMLPYLFLIIQMILLSTITSVNEAASENMPTFVEMLAGAYGNSWWVLFVALLVGTGSIAADNRANALQVYLSKPITRKDYLIGKLMSVFVPVYAVTLLPMLMATSFAAFDQGVGAFISEHPVLFPSIIVVAAIPAIVHASLLCGISAWNKTPWAVGVSYVGVVFFWNIASTILVFAIGQDIGSQAATTIRFFSIDGAISGLGYRILGNMPRQGFGGDRVVFPDPVPLAMLLAVAIAIGILLCYRRIRAVEVVTG